MIFRASFLWALVRSCAICALLAFGDPVSAQLSGEPTLAQIEAAASNGQIDAQLALADRYHKGNGVLQDFALAAEWYEKAADQGSAAAQNQLARYRFEGFGGPKDTDAALALFEAAAKSGKPQYLFDLATVLEKMPATVPRAAELYARAANGGSLDAAVSLGVLYQEGKGVAQDFARARALYDAPAQQGHARALNNLGLLYVRGTGVAQDYALAAQYFSAAVERGLKTAMTNLGVLYENGFGVPLDEARAVELYRMGGGRPPNGDLAVEPTIVYDPRLVPVDTSEEAINRLQALAEAGDPVAQFQFGWVLLQLKDAPFANFLRAGRLFEAAAQKGHGPAMANLGTLYFEGRGLPQDFVLGQMWLLRAERAGVTEARRLSDRFAVKLTAGQINEAQAMIRVDHRDD